MFSVKHLTDAKMILEREISGLQAQIQCARTDASDSDAGFQRRLDGVLERIAEHDRELEKIQKQRATLLAEVERMKSARTDGHATINALAAKSHQAEVNLRVIELALLQAKVLEQ
jgi:hypothetical protein